MSLITMALSALLCAQPDQWPALAVRAFPEEYRQPIMPDAPSKTKSGSELTSSGFVLPDSSWIILELSQWQRGDEVQLGVLALHRERRVTQLLHFESSLGETQDGNGASRPDYGFGYVFPLDNATCAVPVWRQIDGNSQMRLYAWTLHDNSVVVLDERWDENPGLSPLVLGDRLGARVVSTAMDDVDVLALTDRFTQKSVHVLAGPRSLPSEPYGTSFGDSWFASGPNATSLICGLHLPATMRIECLDLAAASVSRWEITKETIDAALQGRSAYVALCNPMERAEEGDLIVVVGGAGVREAWIVDRSNGALIRHWRLDSVRDVLCAIASSEANIIAIVDKTPAFGQSLMVMDLQGQLIGKCDFYKEFRGATLFAITSQGRLIMHSRDTVWETDPRSDFRSTILFSVNPDVQDGH